MSAPKLFISYSWSNSDHEQWVVDFATELRESGVDVILDKWDLKEGHDAVVFMEKVVNDPEIKKVTIICDERYAAKADGRDGGVGTETQIISREVYENQSQEKFVAVVREKDGSGNPYLPTYYKSRIYIDLSEPDRYGANFEQLLRWIFNKPLYVKPELGTMPSFLSEGEHVTLGTSAQFKRCIDAIRQHKPYGAGAFDEYCNLFSSNLERFRISTCEKGYDDLLVKNIEEFLPYRNEAIQLFIVVAQYSPTAEFMQRIHRLFESLIPYMHKPVNITQWREWSFDNFKFLIHELFLYVLAIFLKYERFDAATCFLDQQYYLSWHPDSGQNIMCSFTVFRKYTQSLDDRNERLKLRRLSVRADLLNERCKGTGIDFHDLLQADFVAFMRAEVKRKNAWWPETLLYLDQFNQPFEIFARSASKAYFDRVKVLLAINTPKDLNELLKSYREDPRKLPTWEFESFEPETLLGYHRLATRP